jgi:uncharacterized protein (DUF2267 family)
MNATGLAHIDHSVHQTNIWLGELMMMLNWTDRAHAYRALHTVLPLLRAHLPVNEASHLSAQLPLLIRALFFEGWHPAAEPLKDRSGGEFIDRVGKAFANIAGAHPSEIITAVFALLSRHVTPGEINVVKLALPEGVRRYWPMEQRPAGEIKFQ